MVELLSDVLAEGVASASRIHAPASSFIGIGPQQIAHWSLVWNFLHSFEGSDVIESFNAGRKTAVQAEELILDDSSQGKVIEELSQALPDVGVSVLAAALIVKSINLRDLPGLVISP